ncbi:MAG: SRPBCC domain-containing protein [Bacteroidota bacterium]
MLSSIPALALAQEKVETQKVGFGHRTIYTEIIIDASPEQVWSVLTDTPSYSDWAVFMEQIEGKIKDQGEIIAYFKFNEDKDKLNEIPHIISVTPGREFAWSETFMMGMTDHHRFIVEATADGKTRFIQSDSVSGGIAWLLGKSLINIEEANYPRFNRSLKAEVERRFANTQS